MPPTDKSRRISSAELQFLLAATENHRVIEDGNVSVEDLGQLRDALVEISQGQAASGVEVELGLLDGAELAILRRVTEIIARPVILLAASAGGVKANKLGIEWLDPNVAEARFKALQAVIAGGSQASQADEARALTERLRGQAAEELLRRLSNYALDASAHTAFLRRQVSERERPNSQALVERQKRLADRINRALGNLAGVDTSEKLKARLEAGLGEGFAAEHAEIAVFPALPKGSFDMDKTLARNAAQEEFAARVKARSERLGLLTPAALEDVIDRDKIRVPGIGDIVYFSLTTDPLESLVDSIEWTNIAFEANQISDRSFFDVELERKARLVDKTLQILSHNGGISAAKISDTLLDAVIAVMDSSKSRQDSSLIDWKDQEPKIRALGELLQLKSRGEQISAQRLSDTLFRVQMSSQPSQERSNNSDIETAMRFLDGENIRSPEAWERFIEHLMTQGVVTNRETAISDLQNPDSSLRASLANSSHWQDRVAEFEAVFREGGGPLVAKSRGREGKESAEKLNVKARGK